MTVTSIHGFLLLLLLAAAALALLLLSLGAVALYRAHRAAIAAWIRLHTTAQERAVLAALAHDAVLWVERFGASPAGQAKFAAAVALVTKWLAARGLVLAEGAVEAAIQAAFAALSQSGVLAASGPNVHAAPPAPKA